LYYSEDELRDFFRGCGRIVDIHLPKDRNTGKPRGIAFVRFEEKQDADEGLKLNERELGGRRVGVYVSNC
jgi:cold-inducible RNA-binding protein